MHKHERTIAAICSEKHGNSPTRSTQAFSSTDGRATLEDRHVVTVPSARNHFAHPCTTTNTFWSCTSLNKASAM
jgi:hypothetical protein